MDSVLHPHNDYKTVSALEWPGLTSNKFPPPRLIHEKRDIIKSGLDFPDQTSRATRRHFQPQRSGQFEFRPITKQVGEMQHWHLRAPCKKILDLQFSQPHPRRERSHFVQPIYVHEPRYAGIQTFYKTQMPGGNTQYSLEDKMQRKVRVDQLSLRKNKVRYQNFLAEKRPPRMRF